MTDRFYLKPTLIAGAAAGLGAAVAVGIVLDKKLAERRKADPPRSAYPLGTMTGRDVKVLTDDGIELHAEVDELPDHVEPSGRAPGNARPTVVLVHGFALNLHCWHYQREALRKHYRVVSFDQRSHGRSERSTLQQERIDQLGRDLAAVIEQLAAEDKVVLIGHSMGGMAIAALAEQHPDWFTDQVVGVALISTTAGGMASHNVVSRYLPDRLGRRLVESSLVVAAHTENLVEFARRSSSVISVRAITEFGFGTRGASAEQIRFIEQMLAATPLRVLVDFIPEFDLLDKFEHVAVLSAVPTWVLAGTKDKIVSVGHARKLASRIKGSHLEEYDGVGHLPIFEVADEVTEDLFDLLEAAEARMRP